MDLIDFVFALSILSFVVFEQIVCDSFYAFFMAMSVGLEKAGFPYPGEGANLREAVKNSFYAEDVDRSYEATANDFYRSWSALQADF